MLLMLFVKYLYIWLRFKVVVDKSCREGHFFQTQYTALIDCEYFPLWLIVFHFIPGIVCTHLGQSGVYHIGKSFTVKSR